MEQTDLRMKIKNKKKDRRIEEQKIEKQRNRGIDG